MKKQVTISNVDDIVTLLLEKQPLTSKITIEEVQISGDDDVRVVEEVNREDDEVKVVGEVARSVSTKEEEGHVKEHLETGRNMRSEGIPNKF